MAEYEIWADAMPPHATETMLVPTDLWHKEVSTRGLCFVKRFEATDREDAQDVYEKFLLGRGEVMALFELRRRESPIFAPLPRWITFWRQAADFAPDGKEITQVLLQLLDGGECVMSQRSMVGLLDIFRKLDGWSSDTDSYGNPVQVRRLSPTEEREAVLAAPPELRKAYEAEAACNPNAPRTLRREAERTYWKVYGAK